MIYLDTSVALARLLAEDRQPPDSLWTQSLISSRLLEYELWTRLHALRLGASHGDAARILLAKLALVELAPPILARALEPFPMAVRTLDAIHLSAMEYLRNNGQTIVLASYDNRLNEVAAKMRIALFDQQQAPITFQDEEAEYEAWLQQHAAEGFVMNNLEFQPEHIRIHRATCRHLHRPQDHRKRTKPYKKIVSASYRQLFDMAAALGAENPNCKICSPN